jgi:hypothetical protein
VDSGRSCLNIFRDLGVLFQTRCGKEDAGPGEEIRGGPKFGTFISHTDLQCLL